MLRHDALVVGGGPAGLAGALYLARYRRGVVLIDSGDSRAVRIPHSHNVAGFVNGVSGADLLAPMRRQAEQVGVRFITGSVERLLADRDGFRVHWAQGEAAARTVLLATGATDIEPLMPDVAQAVRQGALRYYPACDGYEVSGSHVGVLCSSPTGLHEAIYLRHFTPHLHVFVTPPGSAFSGEDQRLMAERGIVLHADPVRDFRLYQGRLSIRHGDGETVCDSLYAALGMQVHSQLAAECGARRDADGYLLTDRHQQTSVPGLYCAGDVAKGLKQISVAIGAAAIAASAMHARIGQAHIPRRRHVHSDDHGDILD